MTATHHKRPLGVTIRGLFYLIEGTIAILCGVLLSATTKYITNYLDNFPENHQISIFLGIFNGSISYVFIIWLVVAGSAGIIIGIGILKGKKWAWKITIIQTLFSVSVGVIYFVFPSTTDMASKIIGTSLEIIIGSVIIYYFYRPHVIAYFNRLSA